VKMDTILDKLDELQGSLVQLDKKVDFIVESKRMNSDKISRALDSPLDVMTLLALPDNLRKTAMALSRLREAAAVDVSKETHRERAVESAYLNQLVNMGYVQKERKGRIALFTIKE
jgi:hypothetical protein